MTAVAGDRRGAPTVRWQDWSGSRTADGGARQGGADLWATYAAVRSLRWLDSRLGDPDAAAAFLRGHQNTDGGFAWERGLRSDVWATFYCTQALADMGRSPAHPERLAGWLARLGARGGGFGMTPGQAADVWSTYYTVRTFDEILRRRPPAAAATAAWLARLQGPDGGMAWSEGRDGADTRAGYYAAVTWAKLGGPAAGPSLDRDALASWLRRRQDGAGGFRFNDAVEPCLWATFRATAGLAALGGAPADRSACLAWIVRHRGGEGGFRRWRWYERSDVWASFSATGAYRALDARLPAHVRAGLEAFLRSCQLDGSGCNYRPPGDDGDALATAALALLAGLDRSAGARRVRRSAGAWLARAHMPSEGGVMYMPARGAEVRCTLWAAASGGDSGAVLDRPRVGPWLRSLQNADGGFGYWEGRGSDVTATVAALETLATLRLDPGAVDTVAARGFVRSCEGAGEVRFSPGGAATAASTCHGLRALALTGDRRRAERLLDGLAGYRSPLGGYGATPRSLPDLNSTYQVVLTLQAGARPWPVDAVARFLRRTHRGRGRHAWSPVADADGGILAATLAALLGEAVRTADSSAPFRLPRLCL